MRKKDNKKDGAFPMSMNLHSSAASRHPIDEDMPSRMCGPAALNKRLLKGGSSSPRSQSTATRQERFSLLPSHSVESVEEVYYDDMPDDRNPKDDIHSSERIDFSLDGKRSSSLSRDAQKTIFVPQFNVQKAKEHRARQQPQVKTHLSTVSEGSNESQLPSPSFSSVSEKFKSNRERAIERESNTASDIRDQRIERMMKKMQEIIMQQEDNLQTLGEQNRQYREKLSTFQDHIWNLKKEQLNQKNEIQKLNFERESVEAEAMVLKEELRVIRSELDNAKQSTTTNESAQSIAVNSNANDSTPDSTPIGVPFARSYSVSFEHRAEIFGEPFEEPDNVEQSSSWERSRQRSIFRSKSSEMDPPMTTLTKPTLDTTQEAWQPSDDEWQETCPSPGWHPLDEECKERHPSHKQSTSGKCFDLQELQQRATRLRETVATMKLDSPNDSPTFRYSDEEDARDDIAHDNRKGNRALRYSQSEERTIYWDNRDP